MRGAALALLLVALATEPAGATGERRVASTTVCADQYVLALAAPGQIVALSPDATDATLSFAAARAASYPRVEPSAEALLALKPDVVLSEGYARRDTGRLLARLGIDVMMVPEASSFAGVAAALRAIGARIGRAARAEALIADTERRLAALEAEAAGQPRPAALYLLPTGTTAGRATYLDEVLTTAGFRNDAALRGLHGWRRIALEDLVRQPPTLLITSFADRRSHSVITGFAANRATRSLLARTPTITVPNALWVCAGPMLIDAAEHLSRSRARLGADP